MRNWDLTRTLSNHPNVARIPPKLVHIRQYAMDMAYMPPYAEDDTRKTFKMHVYVVLMRMDEVSHRIPAPQIVRKYPGIPWGSIQKNLHAFLVSDMLKSAWFGAIHDTVPTNDRLAATHLTAINSCSRRGEPDSIQHKITKCVEGRLIWIGMQAKLGMKLRMDPRHIPPDWMIRHSFEYWPTQRQAAPLWIIAHLVYYRLQSSRALSVRELWIL